MLACPGCGANLTYNIEKGRLFCSYCSSDYAPNDKRLKQRMAGEQQTDGDGQIDAKIFTCPQCGGEMYTTDVDATAYCSYCGASNVLQSRVEGVDAPQKIIPFTVTKEECVKTFHQLAKKTLYAPLEFRSVRSDGDGKGSGTEKLRPLYVPYRVFDLKLQGNAEIPGKATWIDGASRITEDRMIHCSIKADFKNMEYDASAAFDDTLAEQIAPFDMKQAQNFDPVYLAGAYANIPDVDTDTYRQKALEYAAQKSIDALGGKEILSQIELTEYEDGSSLTDHMPVEKESNYTALLPVWFMSFRRGKRIAYAAVNGSTGKVYSDIPVSLPAFWIGSFLTAIPIFVLLNMFVTLLPADGLLAACFLALIGAILYAGNYISILRREEHLDDAGYQAGVGGNAGIRAAAVDSGHKAAGGNRIVRWIKGQDRGSMPKVKRDATYYFVKAFGMWPYLLLTVVAAVMFPPLFWAIILVGSAVYCLRKTGGRIALWSALLIAAAGAGLVMRELPLVSDLWYYGCTTAILLVLVISLTRLLHQYNLLSTRPLPLLFKDGRVSGGDGKDAGGSGKGGSGSNGAANVLLLMLVSAMLLQLLTPFYAKAAGGPDFPCYTNSETGYKAAVVDEEDLLNEEEEEKLSVQLQDLTQYGNALFLSCKQYDTDETLEFAKNWYYGYFGNESGTIFVIDMGARKIALYSAGANNEIIRREEGYVITDNVYTYASAGEYYQCAASAFDQVGRLLEGGKIARPMKYINNALLALILAVLINYAIISTQASKRRISRDKIFGDEKYVPSVKGTNWSVSKSVKVFSFTGFCTILARFIIQAILEGSSSGGGGSSSGGGGFSGGGGGGASGSGGSHRF